MAKIQYQKQEHSVVSPFDVPLRFLVTSHWKTTLHKSYLLVTALLLQCFFRLLAKGQIYLRERKRGTVRALLFIVFDVQDGYAVNHETGFFVLYKYASAMVCVCVCVCVRACLRACVRVNCTQHTAG